MTHRGRFRCQTKKHWQRTYFKQ